MFEVHISTQNLIETEIDSFIEFCKRIVAKPIIIELEEGVIAQQPMISKVFTGIPKGSIHKHIEDLKNKFTENGYEIKRVKVETPLNHTALGEVEFSSYKGKYYEWHGKVFYKNLKTLEATVKTVRHAHLSRNNLKGEQKQRFVTLRCFSNESYFRNEVAYLKRVLLSKNFEVTKEEYEYCVYDSNKDLDAGWIDIPEITDQYYLELLAFEGFLRRAAKCSEDFILKGSLLTRQYIKEKGNRHPNDLDFVYAHHIDNDDNASNLFSDWVRKVTETEVNDDVYFRSFKENDFWRGIDYAMDDDFPTTNTDLYCSVRKQTIESLSLDISWNLPLDDEMVELLYHPIEGSPFIIPKTIPLPLQISWKLHQTIVRPRTKDLVDIILMLEHNKLSPKQVQRIAYHFAKECKKDNISSKRIFFYTRKEVSKHYTEVEKQLQSKFKNFQTFKTKFGFEFTDALSFEALKRQYSMELNYKNMVEIIRDFENKLFDLDIESHIKNII